MSLAKQSQYFCCFLKKAVMEKMKAGADFRPLPVDCWQNSTIF